MVITVVGNIVQTIVVIIHKYLAFSVDLNQNILTILANYVNLNTSN